MPGPITRLAPAPPVLNIALLDRLRAAGGGFVVLEDLAGGKGAGERERELDRVRADLEALAAFGFAIERHPYRGAAYAGPANRLCPDQIEHELKTRRVGRRIMVWSRVSSTNDLAAEAVGSTEADGLIVLAEEQTAGRGRLGRAWTAPPRSCILMSVLLVPDSELHPHPGSDPDGLEGRGWLTAMAAVATAEVVSDLVGRRADIKWPNDVRVDGRKIAGILVERPAVPEPDPGSPGSMPERRARPAVVGIGLNVNVVRDDLPDELRDRATSIQIETGFPADRSEAARALIRRLDYWYDAVHTAGAGAGALNAAWRDRIEGLGRLVRVLTPDGPRTGRFVDLDLRRGLTLALADGPDTAGSPHPCIPLPDILAVEPASPT
ncbi:MAG: biotin--[acetyl-CoA-carboxylase] ligase [Isosphaeraceae bacterium]